VYEVTFLIVAALIIASSIDYDRRMWRRNAEGNRETDPKLATWILLTVFITLSTWMYCHSPRVSLKGNVALFSSLVNIISILTSVILVKWKDGKLFVKFDLSQKLCLLGGGIAVGFWFVTHDPFLSYVLLQIIALCAYGATVVKLWGAKESSEPVTTWALVLTACFFAAYPAVIDHDKFAYVFLARAIPSTAFMVFLITRIKARMVGKTVWQYFSDGTSSRLDVLVEKFVWLP
jgi:hypothetical protein